MLRTLFHQAGVRHLCLHLASGVLRNVLSHFALSHLRGDLPVQLSKPGISKTAHRVSLPKW